MAPPSTSRYEEQPAQAGLRDLVTCTWRQQVGAAGHVQRVVPDGCVDLIWSAGRGLVVAGPATRAVLARLPGGSTTVGVRVRPGAGAAVLGVPLTELRDEFVALEELWRGGGTTGWPAGGGARRELARRTEDALARAPSEDARRALLAAMVLEVRRRGTAPRADPIVGEAARRLAAPGTTATVAALGDALGLSERQLLRRFRAAVGYGPKTFARVLRFQRFLAAAWGPAAASSAWPRETPSGALAATPAAGERSFALARLALDAGYADQAHLGRECRALAGVPPGELLRGA